MDIFTDEFLAFLELKQDLLYHKIPQKKIPYYVNEALQFGKKCVAELPTMNVEKLYTDANIDIMEETHDGVFFKVEMRAQFESNRKGNHLVYIYQASINKLAKANNLTTEQMKNIVLAHEYFHYLEESTKQHVFEILDSIETMKVLGVTRTAKIRRSSEIAANAFAKEVIGLNHLPSYFDYQYLLKENKLTFSNLDDDYQEYTKIFSK